MAGRTVPSDDETQGVGDRAADVHASREEFEHQPAPFVGENPKQASAAQADGSNRIKDPEDWVTGNEPMTGAQKSYLKTLSEQVHEPEAYDPALGKAEASERIDDLKRKRDSGAE